jgi:hypothetical protein
VKLVPAVKRIACDIDGSEEVSVKVEEATDKRGEIPEATTFPDIKTEHEVKLLGGVSSGNAS